MRHTDLLPSSPGRSADPLDRMLSAFFRAEMPNPWPNAPTPVRNVPAPAPAPRADSPRLSWNVSPSLSMAATVALLLAGYAWLAGQFPPPQDLLRPGPDGPITGWNKGVAPLPNGREAQYQEQRLPDGRVNIHVEESQRPSPPR